MELIEFSNEFDIIYENISKGGAPGLIPYEKSVILTQAAEYLALQVYGEDPGLVANLIKVVDLGESLNVFDKLDQRSIMFDLPTDTLRILNEMAITNDDALLSVIPMSHIEYTIAMVKPYRYPRRRTAWRLENSDLETGVVEIIGRPEDDIVGYRVRIITLPSPIILEELTGDLSIRGQTAQMNTNLIPPLHPRILTVATKLAEEYYMDKYGSDGSQNNQ